MRESIKQFVKIVADTLPLMEPIFEFGSFQVSGQEHFADLRPFFPSKEYVGCDSRKGPGVDRILDLHCIDLPSETVGTVLLMDTLEHVEYCRKALGEVHRILKPDGLLVASSVMRFPIHEYPHDYWRFTPQGLRSLLTPFNLSFVDFLGVPNFPHTVIGLASKGSIPQTCMSEFAEQINIWKKCWTESPWKMLKHSLEPLIPPILLEIHRNMRQR